MKLETKRHELLNILKAAGVYFAFVFGAGFVSGGFASRVAIALGKGQYGER